MQLIIQSNAAFTGQMSMNQLVLFKVKNLAPDAARLIDEFLGGFAFYKLNLDHTPSSDLQKDLILMMRKNMQSHKERIGSCMVMLMMKDASKDIPQVAKLSAVTKHIGLPISNDMFEVCSWFAMVEFLHRTGRNYALYAKVLSGYLSHVTRTIVHVTPVEDMVA